MSKTEIREFEGRTYHRRWMREDYDAGLVTVIIPTYNRSYFLGRAIECVFKQTYRPIELIVVDDGSSDETSGAADLWQKRCSADEGFLFKYFYQENRGASAARNFGLVESRGEFISFLDSDDILLPSKIEKQANLLCKSSDAPLCYCITDYLNDNGDKCESLGEPPSTDPILNAVKPFFGCIAPLWRRKPLIETGPWDEELTGREDWVHRARALVKYGAGIFLGENLCLKVLHDGDRISKHGDRKFARESLACAYYVMDLIDKDPRVTAAAKTQLAAEMSGPFKNLVRRRDYDEAKDVLKKMVRLAHGLRWFRYFLIWSTWKVFSPRWVHRMGSLFGKL